MRASLGVAMQLHDLRPFYRRSPRSLRVAVAIRRFARSGPKLASSRATVRRACARDARRSEREHRPAKPADRSRSMRTIDAVGKFTASVADTDMRRMLDAAEALKKRRASAEQNSVQALSWLKSEGRANAACWREDALQPPFLRRPLASPRSRQDGIEVVDRAPHPRRLVVHDRRSLSPFVSRRQQAPPTVVRPALETLSQSPSEGRSTTRRTTWRPRLGGPPPTRQDRRPP
jgi:hypothetical protein